MSVDFIGGIFLVVVGLIIALFSKSLVAILPVFYGVLAILGGASYIMQAFSLRGDAKSNVILWVLGLLFVIGGVIIIFNPFKALELLVRVFGILLAVMGVSEAFTYFYYKKQR